MEIEKLSGKITGVKDGHGLRIGGRPVQMGPLQNVNLAEGDQVTAVGHSGAEFQVLALRNETTGVQYLPHHGSEPKVTVDVPGIIVGILLIPVILGFFALADQWKRYQRDVQYRDNFRKTAQTMARVKEMLGSAK